MTIKSKFEKGTKVWFLNEDNKYERGKIVDFRCWDPYNGFTYDIEDIGYHNHFRKENEIYLSKDEIIETLFVEFGYEDKI